MAQTDPTLPSAALGRADFSALRDALAWLREYDEQMQDCFDLTALSAYHMGRLAESIQVTRDQINNLLIVASVYMNEPDAETRRGE